jgi:cellulose synthase/poly-beta-1,6-N-acetylglucosamine synthase-like glycosyltransferase
MGDFSLRFTFKERKGKRQGLFTGGAEYFLYASFMLLSCFLYASFMLPLKGFFHASFEGVPSCFL